MKIIYDKTGRVKYSISSHGNKKIVRDFSGRIIGFMQDDKTYDSSGRIVAYGEDVSALMEEK